VCILPTAAHESVAATQRALRDRMTAARRLALEDASLLSQDPLLPGRSGENSMISTPRRNCARALKCSIALLIVAVITARAGTDPLSSEIPQKFTPSEVSFDYVKRVAMIPMRDGVKLYTLILIPRGAQRAPILLTRTPYGADSRIAPNPSAHLAEVIDSTDVADEAVVQGGYIRVLQDVRGKYKSEGDYVMNRPLRGPLNTTEVDHSTDTYDTIEWLVHNIPESNAKVGILGISYDGFTTLMALFHPHPALRAAVPINAMVDGWMGDDRFHNGAFRVSSLTYAHDQEAKSDSATKWWSDHYDDYDTWLAAGSAGETAQLHGLDQVGRATPSTSCSPKSPCQYRSCSCTVCGIRRTFTEILPYTRPSSPRIRTTLRCSWSQVRGSITSKGSTAAPLVRFSLAATRHSTFGGTCCARSSTIF